MRHRLLSAGRWYLDDRSLGVLRAELQGHWLDRLTTGPDTRGGTERCAPAVVPRRGGGADGDRAPALRSGHHDRQIGSLGAGLHRVRLAPGSGNRCLCCHSRRDGERGVRVGARLLGVSFGALSPTTQLSLLPAGDSAPRSAASDDTLAGVAPADGAAAPVRWVPGQEVLYTELGRGWLVRALDTGTPPSGAPEIGVRCEVTGSRSARQRRSAADDAQMIEVDPVQVRPLSAGPECVNPACPTVAGPTLSEHLARGGARRNVNQLSGQCWEAHHGGGTGGRSDPAIAGRPALRDVVGGRTHHERRTRVRHAR